MPPITITMLGLAAVKISDGRTNVYADAFFSKHPIAPFDGSDASIVLVTHDHADHYDAGAVAAVARRSRAMVVGPPSIAYPLLVDHGLPAERLRILYHQDPHTPVRTEACGVTIEAYSSLHFNDGDNMTIHNSYLLEMGGRRIYVTGDSNRISTRVKRLQNVDALLYNLVVFDKDLSRVSELETAVNTFAPKLLLPTHVIGCDWTIPPAELRREVERRDLRSVRVIEDSQGALVI